MVVLAVVVLVVIVAVVTQRSAVLKRWTARWDKSDYWEGKLDCDVSGLSALLCRWRGEEEERRELLVPPPPPTNTPPPPPSHLSQYTMTPHALRCRWTGRNLGCCHGFLPAGESDNSAIRWPSISSMYLFMPVFYSIVWTLTPGSVRVWLVASCSPSTERHCRWTELPNHCCSSVRCPPPPPPLWLRSRVCGDKQVVERLSSVTRGRAWQFDWVC